MKLIVILASFILLPSVFISCGQQGPLTLPTTVSSVDTALGNQVNG